MLTEELYCAVEQFSAVLNMTLDVLGPTVPLGRVALTGIAGMARLHTNKEVLASYSYFMYSYRPRGHIKRRVTTCLENLEMSRNLSAVREMSEY